MGKGIDMGSILLLVVVLGVGGWLVLGGGFATVQGMLQGGGGTNASTTTADPSTVKISKSDKKKISKKVKGSDAVVKAGLKGTSNNVKGMVTGTGKVIPGGVAPIQTTTDPKAPPPGGYHPAATRQQLIDAGAITGYARTLFATSLARPISIS